MGGRTSQEQRKILMTLQDGLCHYCREPMVLPDPYPEQKSQIGMPRLCTIEHLRDRYDPRRHEPTVPGERRRVGACRGCNQGLSLRRQKIFGPNPPRRGGIKNVKPGHVHRPPNVVRSPAERFLRRTFIKPPYRRKPIWWRSDHLYWGLAIGIALGYLLGR